MKQSRRTFSPEFKAKVAIEAIKEIKKLKKDNDDLVHQIGQLTVDINWLKKASMIPLELRHNMVDRGEGSRNICDQCELLGIARSTLSYTASKADEKDLNLMEELDRLYLEDPTREASSPRRSKQNI